MKNTLPAATLPAATSAAPIPPVVVRNAPLSGGWPVAFPTAVMPPSIGSSSAALQQSAALQPQQSFTSISGSDESGK
eukprot:1499106-Prymnesium_polylepis.1